MKLLKYINIGVLCLAALAMVLFYAGAFGDINDANTPGADVLLYFAYALTVLALAFVAGFYIYTLIEHPKQIKFVLMLVAGVAILTIVCYYFTTPTAMKLDPELERATSSTAIRWTETGIFGAYILFAGAFISIIVGSIRNMLK